MHTWNENDDIIVLYLYKCESRSRIRHLPFTFEQISARRAMSVAAIKRRIDNFEFLDTGKPQGGSNYAALSKRVYERFKGESCNNLRSRAVRILNDGR